MNIDIDKLTKKKNFSDWGLASILECEIKPVNCDGCSHLNEEVAVSYCATCLDNKYLVSNFNPKQNELDNWFISAPLMSKRKMINEWKLVQYKVIKGISNDIQIRLPTVKESPHNVWLAPWLEMPKELEGKRLLIWWKWVKGVRNDFIQECVFESTIDNWDRVLKLQIIESEE